MMSHHPDDRTTRADNVAFVRAVCAAPRTSSCNSECERAAERARSLRSTHGTEKRLAAAAARVRAGSAARPISGALRLTSPLLLTALSQRCLWLQAGSTIGQRLRAGHSQHRRQGRHGWAWVGLMVGARGRLCEAACAVETAVEKTRCRTRVTTFYSAHAASHAGCRGSTALQRSTALYSLYSLYSLLQLYSLYIIQHSTPCLWFEAPVVPMRGARPSSLSPSRCR